MRARGSGRIAHIVTPETKVALVQRSRGYSERQPLSIADIRAVSARIKAANPNCIVFVDNCYGEFVETEEPTAIADVDIMAGVSHQESRRRTCSDGRLYRRAQ